MKRSLTAREWFLMGLLAVVAAASCYILLFYMPVTERRDRAAAQTIQCQSELADARERADEKARMQQTLDRLFAREEPPLSLAPYDNLQPVMLELNTILSASTNYALSFGSVDSDGSLVRRSISINFTAGSYDAAKQILRQLRDSAYRCMLDTLNVSIGQGSSGGTVSVNGNIVFFEYQ